MKNYTCEQLDAINSSKYRIKISACAGSGKTDVIARRIAKILYSRGKSKGIVCFTFTNKAADEMFSRISKHAKELCPDVSLGDLFVGTIHSFCLHLLKEYSPVFKNYEILSENGRVALLSNPNNFHRIGLDMLKDSKSKFYNIEKFCESADVFREELMDIETVKAKAKSEDEEKFSFIFNRYIELLYEQHLIDFSGILWENLKLLNDPVLLKKIKSDYWMIVCDEYQDINKVQERIISKLFGDSGEICVVGDPNQSIYHWRGSKIEYINNFQVNYKDVSEYPLTTNFRSSDVIIKLANSVIERNTGITNTMKSLRPNEIDAVRLTHYNDSREEARAIVEQIKDLLGTEYLGPSGDIRKVDYRDIAILFRSIKLAGQELVKECENSGIPIRVSGGIGDVFSERFPDLVLKCFSYLTDLEHNSVIYTLEDICEIHSHLIEDTKQKIEFRTSLKRLKEVLPKASKVDIQDIFKTIVGKAGGQKGLLSDTDYLSLAKISKIIAEYETINSPIRYRDLKFFLGYLDGYIGNEVDIFESSQESTDNSVLISTIHRAKGLEFPVVFIPSLSEGLFPLNNRKESLLLNKETYPSEKFQGTIEDERRLFYVAITRAMAFLRVSSIMTRKGKDINPSIFYSEFSKAFKGYNGTIRTKTSLFSSDVTEKTRLVLSPTDAALYLACAYRYKLSNLDGFKPGSKPELGFGNQIHLIIETLLKKELDQKPSLEYLKKLVDKVFYLRYAYGTIAKNAKNRAIDIVYQYINSFEDDLKKFLYSEKSFYARLDNFDLKGVVDLLLRKSESKVEIVDFKTRTGSMEDFGLQLSMYAVGVKLSYGLDVEEAYVHYLNDNLRLPLYLNEQKKNKFIKVMDNISSRIRKKEFPFTENVKMCNECDFLKICPRPDVEGLDPR